MRAYMIVGLGLLIGLRAAWADGYAQPDKAETQPAAEQMTIAPGAGRDPATKAPELTGGQVYFKPAIVPRTTQREVRLTVPPTGFVTAKRIEDRAAAVRVLGDPKAQMRELDLAMQAMNPWPCTFEQINALLTIALERPAGDRVAGNAAIRLGHARWSIPGPLRSEIRDQFRHAVTREKDEPARVEGMLWTLALWGDSDWVWEHLGKTMRDDSLKVWVLIHMFDRKTAVTELLAMIDRCRPKTSLGGWQDRNQFAEALIMIGDKRGVDIAVDLHTVGQTFLPEIGYQTSLPNGLRWLSVSLGYDFTRDDAGRSLEPSAALEALTAWWKANREGWAMDPPDELPADKPLNARQARRLAARLANEAFAKVTFKTPAGQVIGEATIESEESSARLEDNQWLWSGGAARGPRATVTFDAHGGNAKVSIDYVFGDERPYPAPPPEP